MRIAIVNDMALAVESLRRVVTRVPDYQIAWIARDGAEAVAKCRADRPDLILMDLIMPVMDGAEATRQIMTTSPCAILVVTATVTGNFAQVYDAMGHGALDAVNTPILGPNGQGQGADALLRKIAQVAVLIGNSISTAPTPPLPPPPPRLSRGNSPLVAMGASTGGPQAVAEILAGLPSSFPASLVLVQHVDAEFAEGLATWLNERSPLAVRLARAGDRPEPGRVAVAITNDHLFLESDGTFGYTSEPRHLCFRPSVDVFFQSLARSEFSPLAAVLLSGMGRDGAQGLLALRQAGAYTIAQDESTSVIYGMPKAAVALGAAIDVLPLSAIAPALLSRLAPAGS